MCERKDIVCTVCGLSLSLQILMSVRVLRVMITPLVPTLLVASAVRVILATPAMGSLASVGHTPTHTHTHRQPQTHTHS